jgi:hypothetical protein|tara:strand:- start:2005 stop:3039 length:1035 start_codon:yes stop_codon:yes gene_type:complete
MSGIIRNNRTRSSGSIKGLTGVPSVAGDKSPATAGDIWYNSSTNVLRCYVPVAAWSAGGNMGTARRQIGGGFGTSGAAVAASGAPSPATNTTEEYDGSTWSAGGNVTLAAGGAAQAGIITAGIKTGGNQPSPTDSISGCETYDGSSWSGITSMPSESYEHSGCGTQTAFVATGCGGDYTTTTYEWNGASWDSGGACNTPRHYSQCTGTLAAGLLVCGLSSSGNETDEIEEYNGTGWTAVTNYPISVMGMACGGPQTDAMVIGGIDISNPWVTYTKKIYTYDGTNWSAETDYPFPTTYHGVSKNVASGSTDIVCFAGTNQDISPDHNYETYEWLSATTNATITTS